MSSSRAKRGSTVGDLGSWGMDAFNSLASSAKDIFDSAASVMDRISFASPEEQGRPSSVWGLFRSDSPPPANTVPNLAHVDPPSTARSSFSSSSSRAHAKEARAPEKSGNGSVPDIVLNKPATVQAENPGKASKPVSQRYHGQLSGIPTARVGETLPLALGIDLEAKELESGQSHDVWSALSVLAPSVFSSEGEWVRGAVGIVVVVHWDQAAGPGLDAVATTLGMLFKELANGDRVGVVCPGVDALFPPSAVFSVQRQQDDDPSLHSGIEGALEALKGKGAGCGGVSAWECLAAGLDFFSEHFLVESGVSQLLFVSHSAEPCGDDADARVAEITAQLKGLPPSSVVSTFGYDDKHDQPTLAAMALAGGGVYHHMPDEASVAWCLTDSLGGAMSTLGFDVHLHMEAASGVEIREVSTSFTQASVAADKCEIVLGHVAVEESRTVLVSLHVPEFTDERPLSHGPSSRSSSSRSNPPSSLLAVHGAGNGNEEGPQGPRQEALLVTLVYTDAKTRKAFKVQDWVSFQRPVQKVGGRLSMLYRGIGIEREQVRAKAISHFQRAADLALGGQLEQALDEVGALEQAIAASRAAHDPIVLTISMDVNVAKGWLKAQLGAAPGERRRGCGGLLTAVGRHSRQQPAGCVGDAFACPWRDMDSFEEMYEKCPPPSMRSFHPASELASPGWKFKTL